MIKSLHQEYEHTKSQDGMDLSLIVYDKENMEVTFAVANNPLIIVRDNKQSLDSLLQNIDKKFYKVSDENKNLVEIKADKMPIGVYIKDNISFKQNTFKVIKGDTLYLLSDGFQAQFGGPGGHKFIIIN